MSRRTLFLLALVALALGVVSWNAFFAGGDASADHPSEMALERSEGLKPAPAADSEPTQVLPEASMAREAESQEVASSAARVELTEESESGEFQIPDDAWWVEGVVRFPEDTPLGERVEVVAKGRRFGSSKDPDSPREHRVLVDNNGRFRVAFSKSTRKGWISLEGRYLYLEERAKVEPRKFQGLLELEAQVGGRVLGQVRLPEGVIDEPENWKGARGSLSMWNNQGENIRRATDIGVDGRFEINAVPAGDDYNISIDSSLFAGVDLDNQIIRRGEDLQVELTFLLGIRVAGRIIDSQGEPLSKGVLTIKITSTDPDSRHSRVENLPFDQDGVFEKGGMEAGTVVLTLRVPDQMELVEDLGKLEPGEERVGLVLSPLAGNLVAGFVRWQDGSPVAEAKVLVKQKAVDGAYDWEARDFNVETDENGAFRVEGLTERPINIEATAYKPKADGGSTSRRNRGPKIVQRIEDAQPGTTGILLTLQDGSEIHGIVKNDLGEFVERFTIEAQPLREGLDEYERWNQKVDQSVRDEQGAFSVSGLAPGPWQIRARAHKGGVSAWREVEVPGAPHLAFVAPRGASLRGIVRDPKGRFVAGAHVELRPAPVAGGRVWGNNESSDRANSAGEFEFKSVAPGVHWIHATATGWANSERLSVDLAPGQERADFVLQLRTGGRITGEVHPHAGALADREVTCWSSNVHMRERTDGSGKFSFEGLPPGKHRVRLQEPNGLDLEAHEHENLRSTQEVQLAEGESVHIVLGAPPKDPIEVSGVVSAGGEGIPGVRVQWTLGSFKVTEQADSQGRYTALLDGAGQYTVKVDSDEVGSDLYLQREVSQEPKQRIDLELPNSSVSGVVVDSSGAPAADIDLYLVRVDPGQRGNWGKFRNVESDEEGRFRVRWLDPGEYELRAGWAGYWNNRQSDFAISIVEGIRVEAGQERDDLRIEMQPGGRLTVIATKGDGTPAFGVQIMILDEHGRQLSPFGMGQTDGSGRLVCSAIPGGSLTVEAHVEGELKASTSISFLQAGQEEVRLVLSD